jgi:hypothetical protein
VAPVRAQRVNFVHEENGRAVSLTAGHGGAEGLPQPLLALANVLPGNVGAAHGHDPATKLSSHLSDQRRLSNLGRRGREGSAKYSTKYSEAQEESIVERHRRRRPVGPWWGEGEEGRGWRNGEKGEVEVEEVR